ncbi:class I SAM-dependent methyltransferase [Catenulispora subtropica]|uniref:Methyltransferase type 11 domain-containing protein n=1 Tax=Catenulispora subtropica TaxID=450798 RepID=A0ABN2SK49_9ACTN
MTITTRAPVAPAPPPPAVDRVTRAVATRIAAAATGPLTRVLVVGAGGRAAVEALRAGGRDSRVLELALRHDGGPQHAPDVLADGCWLPLPDRVVDLCVSRTRLAAGPDPLGYLAELIRVTRPGGLVAVIGDPDEAKSLGRHLKTRDDVVRIPGRGHGAHLLRRLT